MGVTLTIAANILGITRQALALALAHKRIVGTKVKGRWFFERDEVDRYKKDKYNRRLTRNIDGTLRFRPEEGIYSPALLAEACGVQPQKIYYLLYSKKLGFTRKGSVYIISVKDLETVIRMLNPEDCLVANESKD